MPLDIILPPDSESISLDDFVESIRSARYDFSCRDDIIDSARFLKKLNNNKQFLLDRMLGELKTIAGFQRTNYYGPQVFMLHVADTYFVRANVWRPMSPLEHSIAGFEFDVCHDHNFDILTAGYCGAGYHARCYTYDRRTVVGLLGEEVKLVPEAPFTLHAGRIALYRAKLDVHMQLPPDELSVSLNLIPKNESIRELQFQFEESSGRICRYLQAAGSELVIRLAGVLRDEGFLEPLAAISRENPSPQIRALAVLSQLQISGSREIPRIGSPLVRDIVEKEMACYGTCLRMHAT